MSFKQIHEENRRELELQKAEAKRSARAPEQKRRLDALKKKESEIQAELAKVQALGNLSQLNDELRAVREEIERLQR
jgi:hypothetical protein